MSYLATHTHSPAHTHLHMWPNLPRLLRQVSARVLRGESSHLRAKRKMCSTGEIALHSHGVNILINGTVSLGTPHLLKHFSGFLARLLHAALSIILIWALSGLRPVHLAAPQTTLTSRHAQTWLLMILIIHSREMNADIFKTSHNIAPWNP